MGAGPQAGRSGSLSRRSRQADAVAGASARPAGRGVCPVADRPDPVPVLGYLDDIILLPLGIWLVLRLIPADLIAEHRAAAMLIARRPVSRIAAAVIAIVWIGTAGLLVWAVVFAK